jgi:adenine-specific DNA-methyltransferase
VFQNNGGFDIVIGNPPYGVSIKGAYRTNVVNCLGNVPDYEIYYYFKELSYKTLKNKGVVSYIIPNTFLFNVFAANYCNCLLNKWEIKEILDCTEINIFESATVRNAIILFSKNSHSDLFGYKNTANAENFMELASRKLIIQDIQRLKKNVKNWGLVFKLDIHVLDLVDKIMEGKTNLIEIFPEISQGLIAYDKYQGQSADTIKNRVYHYNDKTKPGLEKWLWGEDVNRYSVQWNGQEYIDYCDGIANPRNPIYFRGERILVREITNPSIYAAYTDVELYNDPAIIIIKAGRNMSIKALLAILNSKLATFYHFNSSPKASKGAFPKILVEDIKYFPLPNVSIDIQKQLDNLANIIINEVKLNKLPTAHENQVNSIVYNLYGLNKDEINTIEKHTKCLFQHNSH